MKRLLSLTLLTFTCALHAQTADYSVQYSRKTAVGDKYRVSTTGADEQSMLIAINNNPMPPRLESYTFEFAATCEVQGVTDRGQESKTQFTVEKLARKSGSQSTDILPAGAVFVAERVGTRTVITLGGEKASPAVAKLLETAGVHMSGDRETGDDEVFGTSERKKIGDSWSINAVAAADSFAKRGLPVDPGKISGTASIVERTEQDGIPAILLVANVTLRDLTPPVIPNVNIDASTLKATFGGLLPLDGTKGRLADRMVIDMTVAARGAQNGATMNMTMTKKTVRDTKYVRN